MTRTTDKPLVCVILGSVSDWETMQVCSETLSEFGVPHDCQAISAHRQPKRLHEYVAESERKGARIFIGAAGGAAHLPGVIASLTTRPVLGVPMKGWATDGLDALLSIAQMPGGVPVGTLAVGKAGAKNAAILAVQILALADTALAARLDAFKRKQGEAASTLPG